MGALQPGLPIPSAIPRVTYKISLDLKDCFYTIPLTPEDCKRLAFSAPSTNLKEPVRSISGQYYLKVWLIALLCVRNLWLKQWENQASISEGVHYPLYG